MLKILSETSENTAKVSKWNTAGNQQKQRDVIFMKIARKFEVYDWKYHREILTLVYM